VSGPASAPASAPAPPAVPFRGTGAAGGLWVVTLILLAVAAFFVALGAAILLQMELDPVDPPPPDAEVDDEGDGRSWHVLGANILALLAGMGAFMAWVAAVGLAAAGRGRLARPVLALGAAVFLAVAAMFTLTLRGASVPGLVGLLVSLLGAFASVVAWRRASPAGETGPIAQS
jgi:hypothetical protein